MRFEARPLLCAMIVTASLLWGFVTLVMYVETLRADFDPSVMSAFLGILRLLRSLLYVHATLFQDEDRSRP